MRALVCGDLLRDSYLHRYFAHAMPLVMACLRVVGTYLSRCPVGARDFEINDKPHARSDVPEDVLKIILMAGSCSRRIGSFH